MPDNGESSGGCPSRVADARRVVNLVESSRTSLAIRGRKAIQVNIPQFVEVHRASWFPGPQSCGSIRRSHLVAGPRLPSG